MSPACCTLTVANFTAALMTAIEPVVAAQAVIGKTAAAEQRRKG
ncbi:MAG: hypothetical protein AB2L14_11260 [Candidatus Xenobiia bacterium LiM19]